MAAKVAGNPKSERHNCPPISSMVELYLLAFAVKVEG